MEYNSPFKNYFNQGSSFIQDLIKQIPSFGDFTDENMVPMPSEPAFPSRPQPPNIPDDSRLEDYFSFNKPKNEIAPTPFVQPTTQDDNDYDTNNTNEVGSLIGQSLAMLGSAYAGRDPSVVANQFARMREINLDRENKINEQKNLMEIKKAERLFQQQQKEADRMFQQQQKEADRNATRENIFVKNQLDFERNQALEENKQRYDEEKIGKSQEFQKQLLQEKKLIDLEINSANQKAKERADLNLLNKKQAFEASQNAKERALKTQELLEKSKSSKEEIKNLQSFKEGTAESSKFMKQLDEYSNLVKKIPMTGGARVEGAKTIRAAQTMRGKLLLSLKSMEQTGALDESMIRVADQILGTADYTRDEVVDAGTNQLKSAIRDDINANAKKFGIIGTAPDKKTGKMFYVDKNNNPVMEVP